MALCEIKCFESRLKENMPRRYHKDATKLLFNATRTHRNRLGIFVQEFGLAYEDSRVTIAHGESIIRIKKYIINGTNKRTERTGKSTSTPLRQRQFYEIIKNENQI